MCGIFGFVNNDTSRAVDLNNLVYRTERRGQDASGMIWWDHDKYQIVKSDVKISQLSKLFPSPKTSFLAGHGRLITTGEEYNQPIEFQGIWVLHNGIVINASELWNSLNLEPHTKIDSEVIAAYFSCHLKKQDSLEKITKNLFSEIRGSVSACVLVPHLGEGILISNNGSLYSGFDSNGVFLFASEAFTLKSSGVNHIHQVAKPVSFQIPISPQFVILNDSTGVNRKIVPPLVKSKEEERLLNYSVKQLRRCSKCILPETMPFIEFDVHNVCNYCRNYVPRNQPKALELLENKLKPYYREGSLKCIFPFSGGRDSSYGLHILVNELGIRPLTYTYDWGMVTDLARRNISLLASEFGVENIVVAADIRKKRAYIRENLRVWLKKPHLGMVSILTAGDKHFFRFVEQLKKETEIDLNIWSINPLEVTHFKAGFLGIQPDFISNRVYQSGISKQFNYQFKRLMRMMENPGYFNSSIWDTISGEYYRSKKKGSDYIHLFDFFKWDESVVDHTLGSYGWEKSPDSASTWRIGDGTAAFYNYVYHRVAGFTEHDTFRSNQIREGSISRSEALKLVELENVPSYTNIRWYLDVLDLDFSEVINKVNSIPRLSSS